MDREQRLQKFQSICCDLIRLYDKKNQDYGNSFSRTWKEYGPVMLAIRLDDKLNRFKTLIRQEAQVQDESIIDTLKDIANYAIMGVMELERM